MDIKQILDSAKNIAIIGLSPDEDKPSNMISRYLIKENYNVFPIYPKFETILNQKVYRSLDEIKEHIDIVVMFRKGVYAKNLIKECIENKVKTLWLQLGITNKEAREIASQNDINFIEDRCIMVEHKLIKGKQW